MNKFEEYYELLRNIDKMKINLSSIEDNIFELSLKTK